MHSFYTVYKDTQGEYSLLKLFVEEALSNNEKVVFKRAYQLKDIEKIADIPNGVLLNTEGLTDDTSAINISISDLFNLVKQYDADFQPKSVNKDLLNEDGTPKVVYHGTNADFEVFDITKNKVITFGNGFYFGENKKIVSEFYAKDNGRVIEAYLNVNNPFIINQEELTDIDSVVEVIGGALGIDNLTIEGVRDVLKSSGYDGLHYKNAQKGNDIWVAFDPEQIKSATNNIGTFNRENADIRYSDRDHHEVDPYSIEPVNGVTDSDKYAYLVNEFLENGYNGRPVVAIGSEKEQSIALTGSHRILAARKAYIDIPVVFIEYDAENALIVELAEARNDEERAYIANELYKEGTISKYVLDLITREDDLNYENYGVPYSEQLRYSDRSEWTKEDRENYAAFEKQITYALSPRNDKRNNIRVMEHTPDVLQAVGLDDKRILMTLNHFKDITHQEGNNPKWHGLTIEQVKEAPIILAHPAIIADSVTRNDSIVVISDLLDNKGRPIVIAINTNGSGRYDYHLVDSNFMTSMYGKDGFEGYIKRFMDQDKLLYIDKKKSHALYKCVGLHLPAGFTQLGFDTIIHKSRNVVKGNNLQEQFSDRDSDYIDSRTLLSNALESVAQTDAEKELLTEYRKHIDIIGIKESELSEITAKIKELSFRSGEKDIKKLEYWKKRADRIRNSINYYDKKLLSLEAAAPLKAVVDRERAKARKKAYEKNREYVKGAVSSYKEQIEKKAKIESITQKALVLNRWMTKPSNKEHIHEAMKPVVTHLLKAIDFSSKQLLGMRGGQYKGMPTQKDISLAQALADVQQMMSEAKIDGEVVLELYGADLDNDMAELLKSVNLYARTVGDNAYVLNQMTLDELHKLDKMVGAIKASVTKMNKFHVVNSKKGIVHTAQQDIRSMNELGQIKLYKSDLMKGVHQMINWGNINPYFAFNRFGEGGKKVFEALQDGWDTFAFHVKKIIDYAKATYSSEDVKQWSEELHEFDVLLPATKEEKANPNFKGNHQKIQMTTAQIMSLYCLQKREQAKGHISGGGIRITDIKTKNGIISQSDGVVLTDKELSRIIGKLTKEQIAVADALQKFMNEVCAEWGNEISMKRFGYKAFGEQNYFPIKSDENVTGDGEVKEKEKSLYRLLNMSFTKALTENANNRIVVDNIFDVFAQHTSEMAKYNALALPVLDAVRWFNYKEKGEKVNGHFNTYGIKQSMEKAFGKDAQNYVNTFLQDINGADNVGRDSIAKGFFSNAKIASVGFNLKVAALQPTSYLRASAVIDPKYLAKVSASPDKVKYGIEMAEKWCGMALWKSLGFYDTNIQRGVAELIKHDKTWKDKVTEASMKGAEKMDKITWGCLWNACEAEVKATRNDLASGSDEYYTAVGKRLREVIYTTQVVDSTMTRSHMMRSSDGKDKMLTMFASEPTLAYNMLMDVFYDWKLTERKTNKSEAFKQHKDKMVRVAMAYTATNLVTSLLETAFQTYRDDDDEEEDLTEYVISFLESFGSNMGITTKIPYVKDLISILQGFTSNRTDTQWVQNLVYASKDWMKIFSGEGNVYKALYRTLSAISQVSGVAMSNAMRELVSFLNLTIGSVYPSLKRYK